MELPDWLYSEVKKAKKPKSKSKPIIGQPSRKTPIADIVPPDAVPVRPVDGDIPRYTGDGNLELENQSRLVPMEKIPDLQDTYKILQQWMNAAPTKAAPEKGWIWGHPDRSYNIQGAFRPSTPDLIGLQHKSYNSARVSDPEGLGTLANELTHYIQKATPERRYVTNPYTVAETERLRETKMFDDSPFLGGNVAQPNPIEMESTLMDYWTKLHATVRQQERHQQLYAPDLRPH